MDMPAIVAMLVLVVIVLAALLRIGQDDKHIDLRKPARNELRRFGAVRYYYPCTITDHDGVDRLALFTRDQIAVALERAAANPEDA